MSLIGFRGQKLGKYDIVLVDIRLQDLASKTLRECKRRGIPTVLDADITSSSVYDGLVVDADYVIYSRDGILSHVGGGSLSDAVQSVSEKVSGIVGVTDGANGSVFCINGTMTHFAAPAVKVIDTLAAGDVFHGAFAYGLAVGLQLEDAICLAHMASSLKCERFGGAATAPSIYDVEKFVKERGRLNINQGRSICGILYVMSC